MRADMSDTLVVAISQSGTTTDTNRSVDLVRDRGAAVLAIVNRRNSDLVDRSDGVLYTSDGRDVEMSVASTKAFYSQVAAGLPPRARHRVARSATLDADREHELLTALRALPDAMRDGRRPAAGDRRGRAAPRAVAPRRGPSSATARTRIAARELRIKLSELCYKAIACDVTEDKKHIDLSSEPLTLVCAAGLAGSNTDDVGKEVAIYRAHRGVPIVIAERAEPGALRRGRRGDRRCPRCTPRLDFVLSHGGRPPVLLRGRARDRRDRAAAARGARRDRGQRAPARSTTCSRGSRPRSRRRPGGSSTACAPAATTARSRRAPACAVASLLRYATGVSPLDAYELEHGKVGTPSTVVQDLTAALTRGIEELTRPIDAIKHQAKTVTVGISRSDETLLQVPLVRGRARRRRAARRPQLPRAAHARRRSTPPSRRSPATPATGSRATRRRRTRRCTSSTAVASRWASRRAPTPTRGSPGPSTASPTQREVTAVRGRRDGRTIVMVPEVKHNQTVGLTLLHVALRRPPRRRRRCGPCSRATRAATRRSSTPSPRPSRRSTTSVLGVGRRRRPADRAGLRARRPAGGRSLTTARASSGSAPTSSRCPASASRCNAARRCAERLFTDAEREYAYRFQRSHEEPRGALRREGSGDEGAGRRPLEVRVPRRRGGAARERRADARAATTRRSSSPNERGVTEWHLSLTHTDSMAMAVALAVG